MYTSAIEKIHQRLMDFYLAEGTDRGGIRYQNCLDTACSWSICSRCKH